MLTPTEATLRGRIGSFRLHALYDSRETTAAAREASKTALDRRLLAEVDPDEALDPAERDRRLGYARKAHFARLALASAKARRKGGQR